jgi:hypothetical protein
VQINLNHKGNFWPRLSIRLGQNSLPIGICTQIHLCAKFLHTTFIVCDCVTELGVSFDGLRNKIISNTCGPDSLGKMMLCRNGIPASVASVVAILHPDLCMFTALHHPTGWHEKEVHISV